MPCRLSALPISHYHISAKYRSSFSLSYLRFRFSSNSNITSLNQNFLERSTSMLSSASPYKIITNSLQAVMESLHLSSQKYFLGAIDQGTSSTRFYLFDETSSVVLSHSVPIITDSPHPGWADQSPIDIMNSVELCLEEALQKAKNLKIQTDQIKAIGLTNQRETTVVWDSETGLPLAPAIVWFDTRTQSLLHKYVNKTPLKSADAFREKTGLPMSTYFSVLKLKWLIEHIPEVKSSYEKKTLRFGTVESWILFNLLGGVHITDVTNASRTMLMNLNTLEWDQDILDFFDLESFCLPNIRTSAENYGNISKGPFKGIPIAGVLGDQQAALVGQRCFGMGQTKNTYGTGCFLLMNTGSKPVLSKHGLVSTVAFQFGSKSSPPAYALEGSVAMSGKIFSWLRENLGVLKSHEDIDKVAMQTIDSDGVVFLPTLTGVFAPYWRGDIKGSIHGLTLETTRHHICRAAIDAVCFQTKMVLDCMQSDLGSPIEKLQVDGGVTNSDFTMQLQSDILQLPIERPEMRELTAFGAALAAGIGIGLWPSVEAIPSFSTVNKISTFTPTITKGDATQSYTKWISLLQKEMDLPVTYS